MSKDKLIRNTDILRKILPREIVDIVKLYTGEGCWRNGKYIQIHRISKDDERYTMLHKRPHIKQIYNKHGTLPWKGITWFKLENGKFIVIYVGYTHIWNGFQHIRGCIWEMNYNQTKVLHRIS